MKTKYIFLTLLLITLFYQSFATSYSWTGNSGTSWSNSGSWSPSGVPDSTSNVTIVSATNAPVMDQNRKVSAFTLTSGTLDLNSYTLTITGNSTFSSGTISNGLLKPSGSLCHFGGTTFNAKIKASCAYFHMNGGTFNNPVELISAGTSSTSGAGGSVF
ncbi:MAG: hypothetical protein IPP71_00480 [Bacteroidetes bacterium]|nr:hypothetical protein [Bacteroidota bacterium]